MVDRLVAAAARALTLLEELTMSDVLDLDAADGIAPEAAAEIRDVMKALREALPVSALYHLRGRSRRERTGRP